MIEIFVCFHVISLAEKRISLEFASLGLLVIICATSQTIHWQIKITEFGISTIHNQ